MNQHRVCIDSGYRYEYAGNARGRWKTSRDDSWDTEFGKVVCGKLVGHRRIDGATVTVVRAGNKLYAATKAVRGLPASKAKPGSRFV